VERATSTSNPVPSSEALCVGEILWDALPAGLFLGGAPFNVACHLRAAGVAATMVSRVGADHLGDEARQRAARYGVGTDLLQVDDTLATGFVRVHVGADGNAEYDIVEPAAWDAIESTDELLGRAREARAIVFGTLAQRSAVTRATIDRVLESAALKVLDINLRAPYDDREIVRRSLERADVVKLNDVELRRLATWFALDGDQHAAVAKLAEMFDVSTVCVTRGRHGAALWRERRWSEHSGFDVEVRDTVGAGDAFLAVLLAGMLTGVDDAALLQHANLIGAYVATQHGAVPEDQPSPAEFAPAPTSAPKPKRRRRA
jgi:fructokinase